MLLPVVLSFQGAEVFFNTPLISAVIVTMVSFLMVSQIPTYSFKKVRVRREYILLLLIVVSVLAAVIWSYPWLTLTSISVFYLLSLPLSAISYRRCAAKESGPVIVSELDQPDTPPEDSK